MVIVVGGGLIGSALALALRRAHVEVTLVEMRGSTVGEAGWDTRIYALSPGSVRLLEECGAWHTLDQGRVGRIEEMRVYGDDAKSSLTFNAYDAGVPSLAVTVEQRALQRALANALAESRVGVRSPAQCETLEWDASAVMLRLAGAETLSAELVVGADGADSWVRAQAGIVSYAESYAQSAVVANFESEKPHGNVAYQWFRRDGVLAYLPLPGSLISIVFSTWDEHARKLAALPAEDFCAAIAESGNGELGALKLITPPVTFPLQRMNVEELIGPRVALVGDAAHVVHPLAGQGVNVGFRDARELVRVLRERGAYSCGDRIVLRRYERARKEDIASMRFTTHALQRLFNNENPWLAGLRNLGLQLTDSARPLKAALIRHAIA